MKKDLKTKKNFNSLREFLRYVIVGGTAFIIDFCSMCFCKEILFQGERLLTSVFIGYMLGLIYNFILCNKFVFENCFRKIQGQEFKSFIIFGIIGLIGLGITEIIMFLLVNILTLNYLLAKIFTATIVLFWNYIARKIVIYK